MLIKLLKTTLLTIFGISLFLGIINNKLDFVEFNAYVGAESEASTDNPNDLKSPSFTFDVNSLSPSTTKYVGGSTLNIKTMLANITTTILIVIPTLAVLFIVIAGAMIILAGGKPEGINKGKTIIQYSIASIVISLFSYSIIKLIIWLLGSTT